MAHEFRAVRRVEFADTDMAGIMHFSNFFRFMESTEHAFYRSLGFSVEGDQGASLGLGWPRVKAECEYKSPLRFEDEVEIRLLVREIRNRSVQFEFRFGKMNGGGSPEEVARGRLTVVCITRDPTTKQMKAVVIPPEIRRKLEVAPEEALAG